MDVALNQFRSECSADEYKNAIKLMFVYAKNIHQNTSLEKYRIIRIGNEKFNSNIWRHPTCQTILCMAGFIKTDDFIILPSEINVSWFYDALQTEMRKLEPAQQEASSSKQEVAQPSASLKLTPNKGIFVPDLKADLTLLSYMTEMGYSLHAAEKGLIATKNQGVQPAMDWIAEHPECHIVETKPLVSADASSVTSTASSEPKYNISSRLHAANEQKHQYQEKLRLEAIKKAKLEKAEDKMAKTYLMKNMQSERTQSKEKYEREKVIRNDAIKNEKMAESIQPSDPNMCLLRIKMPDGQTLQWETEKSTSIKNLYSHVTSLMNDAEEEFNVCIPHPHQLLDASDETSLQDNNLYPKSTVVVLRVKPPAPEVDPSSVEANPVDSSMDADDTLATAEINLPVTPLASEDDTMAL